MIDINHLAQTAVDRCRERILEARRKKGMRVDQVWTGCGGREKPDDLRHQDGT